jgi:hypothetical protein
MLFVSAIRTYSRGWPRSSSTREPSDPPLRMMESIRFFLSYTIIFENIFCFGRSPGRTQDPERRTPSKHPSSFFTNNNEVRKFREFEARSLSLFDESQRLFKSAPSHTGKGSSKLTLIRYGQTKPQALASIGTRRRIEPDIYILYDRLDPERLR